MVKINDETEKQHRRDLLELADHIKHSNDAPNMLAQASYARKAIALIPRIMEHQEARFTYLFDALQKIDNARGGRDAN